MTAQLRQVVPPIWPLLPTNPYPTNIPRACITSPALWKDPVTMIIPATLSTSRRADSNRESTGTAVGAPWASPRFSQEAPGNWSIDPKLVI